MAKKLGKFILWTAAIGTVAAGVYYYLQHKDDEVSEESDDFDDFDDLQEEGPHTTSSADTSERSYVSLDLDTSATDEVEDFFDDEETGSSQSI